MIRGCDLTGTNVRSYCWLDAVRDGRLGIYHMRVEGDSMTGAGIQDGDVVELDAKAPIASGDIAVVLYTSLAIKRVVVEGGQVSLHSANPAYPPLTICPPFEIEVVGKFLRTVPPEEADFIDLTAR